MAEWDTSLQESELFLKCKVTKDTAHRMNNTLGSKYSAVPVIELCEIGHNNYYHAFKIQIVYNVAADSFTLGQSEVSWLVPLQKTM